MLYRATILNHGREIEADGEQTALEQAKADFVAGVDAMIGVDWHNNPYMNKRLTMVIDSMTVEQVP